MALGGCKVSAPFGGRREEPDAVSPARQPPEAIPTSVFRTLRFQLIAIVVLTVATVLAVSQWVDTRLSERAEERDLQERALLALRTVASMWGRTELEALRRELVAINEGDREITAIDIFGLGGGRPEVLLTTRDAPEAAAGTLGPDATTQLTRGSSMTLDRERIGAGVWRVAVPLRRDGALVGAAQVELSLGELARLRRRLRVIDGAFLLCSTLLISFALAFFLERRVARPVAALVAGMQRAESGELGVRVEAARGGEFAFLAGSLNRMLSRLEELTAGLELRVRRATRDLAEKNRELAQANERLWHAQLEIGRSGRLAALGQMAATIAHELGTPLNSVLGYTQLLRRESWPAEAGEKLAIIESQVQRMIETIRSVLDRTRDRELQRAPVALEPLVAEALTIVSSRLAGRDVALHSRVPPDLPPVPADAAALRQVLLNLLTNAIDATEPPGAITVSAAVLPQNGRPEGSLELTVSDTGHGMAPEELRRAVEPFYTTKAPGRGTGLGLAIVDHIVRAHGGQLEVESARGQGTRVRVRLPMEIS